MNKDVFHIVCVTYKCDDLAALEKKIRNVFFTKEYLIEVLIVDTSQDPQSNISPRLFSSNDLNKFFEFSGYYYGLSYLKELHCDEYFNVMFINDSIFSSHIIYCFRHSFKKYLKLMRAGKKTNHIYGRDQARPSGPIIPTCQFFLGLERNLISEGIFFPKIIIDNDLSFSKIKIKLDDLYVGEKHIFEKRLNNWLYPKSIFKGWYQANPYKPIDSLVFARKKLTIYLEHSLIINLSDKKFLLHFEVRDFQSNCLYLADSFFQIWLKFVKRTRLFFSFHWS